MRERTWYRPSMSRPIIGSVALALTREV
jgi:hypothetical protein